ncbi:J domain-containing protein [Formicincola oecophyllae]|uniref:J domain-containing protein n=1 Tax=Formicincola oecophyllae TaxID=2558361 RepID=A0A4Y6U8B4_9PROT|nr:DnaJ C-terminal domain-containing protein [Formicincola oecophyllae]QDH13679.1 J domain-containing protein [Formicincola oecophyllae]
MTADPYAVLGVPKTATDAEIKSAYRKLAKKYHPDANPGDATAEAEFKKVNNAYGLLGDKEKRARFDRGEIDADGNERAPQFSGGFGGGGFGGQAMHEEDLGAFFSDMFGGGRGGFGGGGGFRAGAMPRKGQDLHGEIHVPFDQAVLGGHQDVRIGDRTVDVTIPPGVESGNTLRLRGKGMPGRPGHDGTPGPAGDVLLRLVVGSSPRYRRDGNNLEATQDIDLRTAVLGGKVRVETPKGAVAVTVQPNSSSGTLLRLKGRGIAAHGSQPAGDLILKLAIVLGKAEPELEAFLKDHPNLGTLTGEAA